MTSIIKTDPKEFSSYLKDASHFKGFADRLIIPDTEKEIAEILRDHHEKKIPITITGNRTGLTGGAVAEGGSILATDRLNRVKTLENNFAIVEPGVTLASLFDALGSKQKLYPPDPGEWKAFVGGTVATNASGPRAFKYGTTRRWVRRLRTVLATGEVVDIPRGRFMSDSSGRIYIPLSNGQIKMIHVPHEAPRISKSVVGYFGGSHIDLIDLLIGSEGTLGVVTEIEIELIPAPTDTFMLMIFFPSEKNAWDFCSEIRKLSMIARQNNSGEILEARSIEYFDEGSLNFMFSHYLNIPRSAKAAIYIEQECRDKKRELLVDWFNVIRRSKGFAADTWLASSEDQKEEFREFRHMLPELVNQWLLERNQQKIGTDMAVPPARFEALMNFKKDALGRSGLRYVTFGHIGDSHVHLNMLPENERERVMAKRLYLDFAREAVKLGGTISAEHGIGKIKRGYLPLMLSKGAIHEMVTLKKEFDPELILNRGNLFTDEMLKLI